MLQALMLRHHGHGAVGTAGSLTWLLMEQPQLHPRELIHQFRVREAELVDRGLCLPQRLLCRLQPALRPLQGPEDRLLRRSGFCPSCSAMRILAAPPPAIV